MQAPIVTSAPQAINRTERTIEDSQAPMGVGTTRVLDRVVASMGGLQEAQPVFKHANNVCNAGVLFLLPALISQGLLKGVEIYGSIKKGYYGLLSILLVLSFMFLSRIKTPEQLKNCKPGELAKIVGLDRVPEVRCLRKKIKQTEYGHQTSILTTQQQGSKEFIAGKIFSRWSQENFFEYMMQNFDLDKLTEYGIEAVDPTKTIVNPSYRRNEYQLKKLREKLARVKARFFNIVEENLDKTIDEVRGELEKESKLQDTMKSLEDEIKICLEKRDKTESPITIKDMEPSARYNKLKTESTLFMNVLRMIVYRAETAVVNLLRDHYSRVDEEGRMLVKEIIKSDADLKPDYENKTLTVRLHSLSTPRANKAVESLCEMLNDIESMYPGTDLRLIYKTVTQNQES